MMILLKNNFAGWANHRSVDKFALDLLQLKREEEEIDDFTKELDEFKEKSRNLLSWVTESDTEEPRVRRSDLVHAYAKSKEGDIDSTNNSIANARSVLLSCINCGYVDQDKQNKSLIFMTEEGKSFASIDGLLIAIGKNIRDVLKVWQIIIISIIATLGAANYQLIFGWVKSFLGI